MSDGRRASLRRPTSHRRSVRASPRGCPFRWPWPARAVSGRPSGCRGAPFACTRGPSALPRPAAAAPIIRALAVRPLSSGTRAARPCPSPAASRGSTNSTANVLGGPRGVNTPSTFFASVTVNVPGTGERTLRCVLPRLALRRVQLGRIDGRVPQVPRDAVQAFARRPVTRRTTCPASSITVRTISGFSSCSSLRNTSQPGNVTGFPSLTSFFSSSRRASAALFQCVLQVVREHRAERRIGRE